MRTTLTADDRHRLLRLARRALEARVLGAPASSSAEEYAGHASGVFVSIHRGGELRGCLGRLEAGPIDGLVAALACAVADSDPRFTPVTAPELSEIHIEISVLTPEREVDSPFEIDVGVHGIIVEQGRHRGLLLPQVATEQGWDRHTFVEHACLKAGLRPDAWKHGAHLFVFEAEVFGEGAVEE